MPVVVACSHFAAKMRIPENVVGKPVKCPKCKTVFTAAFEEEDKAAAPRGKAASDPGFEVVGRRPAAVRGGRRSGRRATRTTTMTTSTSGQRPRHRRALGYGGSGCCWRSSGRSFTSAAWASSS